MNINIILFDKFETLDIFGPIEILARVPQHTLGYYSMAGGMIESAQGTRIETRPMSEADRNGILVLPGGAGTRTLVKDGAFLDAIQELAKQAKFCLSICTGSAVLAKAGILDGMRATSNKKAFNWVMENADTVEWIRAARWVKDGRFYTSSGVSAGMDMALGFVADQYGMSTAEGIAEDIEYLWNKDKEVDFFA